MTADKSVVIIDYGMGNLFNLQKAFTHVGARAIVSDDCHVVSQAERLVLPGVGAFGDGMAQLKKRGLLENILKHIESGRPLLGICLGMQLLLTESFEHGQHAGLNAVDGRVIRFRDPESEENFYKIPHVGWNSLSPVSLDKNKWRNSIFNEISSGSFVYFVHSFTVVPENAEVVLSTTEYGRDRFCSALRQGNVYGCQFHPELSGMTGLKILQHFASL